MERERKGKALRLTPEEKRQKRKRQIRNRFLLAIGAVLAAAYCVTAVYFGFHFYKGTVLYGGDCSYLTAAQTKDVLAKQLKKYTFTITERENQQESLTAEQLGISFRDDGGVEAMLKKQYSFIWPFMMLQKKKDNFSAAFSYDQQKTETAVNALACMDEALTKAPKDAYIMATDSEFVVAAETPGNRVEKEKTLQAICTALDEGQTGISLEEADCYQKPAVYQDDETLNKDVESMNQFTGAQITYDFGDRSEYVGTEQIGEWLVKGDDGTYTLDEDAVKAYVKTLADKYDTFGLGREFTTTYGDTVSLYGGDYGWLMAQETTTKDLLAALKEKYAGTMEPSYIYSAMSRDTDDIGSTYVEISISNQYMWVYQDGYLAVQTPVVTGNPNTGHETPADGVWAIDSKMRDYTLRGEDYAAPVNYWMAFNGDVGIHDLVSRTEFGGDIYLTNGSHGCVNTPLNEVEQIYKIVSIGTPVVVYS